MEKKISIFKKQYFINSDIKRYIYNFTKPLKTDLEHLFINNHKSIYSSNSCRIMKNAFTFSNKISTKF